MSHSARAGHRLARRLSALAGGLAAAFLTLTALAPAASAHATLLFTSPAADSAVPVSPKAITLTFNEPVTLAGPPVTLTAAGGQKTGLGPPRQSRGRSVVTVPVASPLGDGVYTVAWQVISADGDPVSSSFTFAVGPAPESLATTAAAQPSTPGLWPLAVARWVLFAALAAALGGLAARALARRYAGPRPGPLPPPWALRACLLGLAAALVLAVLQLGGGSIAAGLAHFSLTRLVASGPGKIAVTEIAAFAAAAVALALRRAVLAVVPLLGVVAAEGLRAHPQAIVSGWGAVLTMAHLLAAALWAGMLFYTVRAAIAWRAGPAAVRALVGLYAKAAAWLFALVVGTGVVAAVVLVTPLSALFTTSYGRVLLVKAALVAVAAGLALAGRLWLRRQPRAGAGPALATRVESGTLAAVLAAAGLLVALPAPAAAASRCRSPRRPAARWPRWPPGPGRSASTPPPAPGSWLSSSPRPRPAARRREPPAAAVAAPRRSPWPARTAGRGRCRCAAAAQAVSSPRPGGPAGRTCSRCGCPRRGRPAAPCPWAFPGPPTPVPGCCGGSSPPCAPPPG